MRPRPWATHWPHHKDMEKKQRELVASGDPGILGPGSGKHQRFISLGSPVMSDRREHKAGTCEGQRTEGAPVELSRVDGHHLPTPRSGLD